MDCEGGGGGGRGGGGDVGLLVRRAEIDTSAPFRSVKEAVLLFGERVLAGEIYAHKLNQIRNESIKKKEHINATAELEPIVAELEETKHSLQRAREESMVMANCLSSLAEELEKTKTELKQLKDREPAVVDRAAVLQRPEAEDVKFVETAADEFEIKTETPTTADQQSTGGLEKKRSVKFANPPSLVRVIDPEEQQALQRQSSVEGEGGGQVKKKKKKKLMPTLSALFSKKKACN